MSEAFLRRSAADVFADPNFERFACAVQAGSLPGIPKSATVEAFRTSDGTVRDVLLGLFRQFPRVDELDVILDDISRAGAAPEQATVDRLEADLADLRPRLDAWYAFLDGCES